MLDWAAMRSASDSRSARELNRDAMEKISKDRALTFFFVSITVEPHN
jgi:hypothetical protein